jgi:hypothetical protein
VAGSILSSSAARTEKGQEQDNLSVAGSISYLPRTRADERRSARGYDRGRGQQVGEEEQGEGREDERNVRR